MDNFETYLLILVLVVAGGALISGVAHRSILSLAIIFLLVVFGSIIIHGASDTPLANRFGELEAAKGGCEG